MAQPLPASWAQAIELEKRLRAELKRKQFWDQDVRKLRYALQQAYANTLFSAFEFAQVGSRLGALPDAWVLVAYLIIDSSPEMLARSTMLAQFVIHFPVGYRQTTWSSSSGSPASTAQLRSSGSA
jgi:hypothetical protein